MPRFYKVSPGEWVQPTRRGYLLKCCGCGLVHEMDFRIAKDSLKRGRIQFRAYLTKGPLKRENIERLQSAMATKKAAAKKRPMPAAFKANAERVAKGLPPLAKKK